MIKCLHILNFQRCIKEPVEGEKAFVEMVDVDPDTLLEWLSMGSGEERDMQLIALEQLCMLLLMSDNVDRCFERYTIFSFLFLILFHFLSYCSFRIRLHIESIYMFSCWESETKIHVCCLVWTELTLC